MTRAEFVRLLETMADGWRRRDYEQTAACFAEDVRYGDPTRYSWRGRDGLLAFFKDDDDKDQQVTWHHVLFDEATQTGAAEYTYVGTHQYRGLVLVKVADGLVTHWREYQHVTDMPWEAFTEDTRFDGGSGGAGEPPQVGSGGGFTPPPREDDLVREIWPDRELPDP